MLVLSRKRGQALVIDGNIRVIIRSVSHGRVQLAIDAPREVNIVREEVVGKDGRNGTGIRETNHGDGMRAVSEDLC